jgi:hypothetical protein
MALAYTAGGLRDLPRTAGEASWAEMETEERIAPEGISASRCGGGLLGSQLEFAAIVGGFHNIGGSAEVR